MRRAFRKADSHRSHPLSSLGRLVSLLSLTSLPQPGLFLVSIVLGTYDTSALFVCSWLDGLSNRGMSFASPKRYLRKADVPNGEG